MIDQIKALEDKAAKALAEATSKEHLEELRVAFLGKKGEITALSRGMKDVAAEQRKEIGQVVNAVKERIGALLDERLAVIAAKEREAELAAARVDVTLPGRRRRLGHLSPLTQVEREINRIFQSLGFVIELGPEVETPHYNFDQLNFPPDHPARDAQDTIFIDEGRLLRTHTSPVQIRVMERTRPPIRMIAPGWVYRSDTLDATHSPMFSQVEGLVVDDGITFGDLFGVLNEFVHQFYGTNVKTRFRPSFFPFTEPSAEMDITCPFCEGKGTVNGARCRVCSGSGWKELLGCGMVDENVLKAVGYDPEHYTGFAFGIGIERLTMFKYGVNEIRHFFEGDVRFISQF